MAWGRRRLGILLVTIVAAGGVLLSSAAADGAGTLVVTTTSDGSDGACTADLCSLRDAVEASNAAGGAVVSVPAGRYTLTLGPLFATAPLELDGAGARVTVIDGNDTEQVVRGDRAARPAIVLSDLTITGGNSQSGDAPDYNEGGGIISWGALTLTRVAVVGNTGQADGGGLNVQGDLTITDSTIANNTAGFSAGGIRAQGGAVSIANTTIAGNTAVERAAIDISLTSHATITNSTIAGNTNASGALDSVNSSSATVTLENDVIANDLTGGTPNCAGTFVSAGHNVATDGSCRLNAEGDLDRAGSVGLGALADNGGGTDTMLPRSGSPLVDAADAAACPAADQRGEARPQGGGCDIGAVETAGPARAGLVQLDAPGDCIAETEIEGCGTPSGAGLAGADWVTASPDGANVYVASSGRPAAVAAFARAADGSLSELGCIAVSGTECASTEAGLGFATSIAVSPDGKNVYVTAADDDTVMIFDRNAVDGTLTPAGCVQDAAARFDRGCATRVHGMVNAYDVAVSPDGKNVYVAAGGGFPELGAVVELARAADGSLSQLASPNDCIEEQGNATPVCGTSTGTGLLAATALALSPDGTSLYAVADTHAVGAGDAPGALAVFARDTATGALTESACIGEATSVTGITECQTTRAAGLSDLVSVAVDPDGTSVYTTSDDATGPIAEFARAGDGSLTSLGCIDSGGSICGTTAPGLASAFGVAVSPDGANVYVAAAGSSSSGGATPVAPGLVELARAADGTLRASDCIQQAGAVSQTCTDTSGHGLGDALGVVVSPDGANVYVASSSSGGAIAAFSRAGGGTPPPPPSNQAPTGAFSETASGLAVSFDASGSSDPDGTIASYAWDFGDGAHGTGVTAAHTYAGGGTYTAVLTVTDDDGAASTASHDVTASAPVTQAPSGQAPPPQLVEFPPAAHIALSPTRGNKRTSFAFSAAGSLGRIASYVWDFGDGATASTRDATHVYGRVGTFTAGLTVRDSSGRSSTAHTQVTVRNALPIPAFTYHSGTGRTLAFNAFGSADADGRVVSYRWAFGDGAVGRGLTLRHRYRGTRTRYTVTLIAVDDSTARGEIRRSISVVPGAGDVSIVEAIAVEDAPVITPPSNVLVDETIGVSDVPSLVPPSSITVVENIGASDGTVPIHHPSPRRLSNQQRRKR